MKTDRFPENPAQHEFRTVLVSNREDLPADAPEQPASVKSLAKLLAAGGWEVRTGYSRAWRRGAKTGTFRKAEFFGVYAGAHDSNPYRVVAIYWRFADKSETYAWFRDTMEIEPIEKPSGEPGGWTWFDPRIVDAQGKRHRTKVTDVKEFARVRGSVLPSWFAAIEKRFIEQAAKELCGDAEEHTPHTWEKQDALKNCSGKAKKQKESEAP